MYKFFGYFYSGRKDTKVVFYSSAYYPNCCQLGIVSGKLNMDDPKKYVELVCDKEMAVSPIPFSDLRDRLLRILRGGTTQDDAECYLYDIDTGNFYGGLLQCNELKVINNVPYVQP